LAERPTHYTVPGENGEEAMSDLKMFRIDKNNVAEVTSQSIELEKSLQNLIDTNLETMLGVRFLGSEYVTGKTHGGRIDTLGIDENYCPVIVEYKRALNENVINQGPLLSGLAS
jgi:RecB family endonuclease NucS